MPFTDRILLLNKRANKISLIAVDELKDIDELLEQKPKRMQIVLVNRRKGIDLIFDLSSFRESTRLKRERRSWSVGVSTWLFFDTFDPSGKTL